MTLLKILNLTCTIILVEFIMLGNIIQNFIFFSISQQNVQKLTVFYAITFIAQDNSRTGRHVTIKRSAIKSDRSFDTKCHANIDR